uniref:Adhesion G protein-coupled receptor E1 n=1 Tax=Pelodiscus sinensis TaxID=13735 RepID=K7GF00_PELSI
MCLEDATCTHLPGGHCCPCKPGFASSSGEQRVTDPAAQCNDIDECSRDPSPCDPNSICSNMLGSYTCMCQAGYLPPSQSGVRFSCTDIDECSRDPSPCGPDSICTNTPGSYTCSCREGYLPPSQPGAPFRCTDIDECSRDPSPCGPNSICSNTPGSYTCMCRAGYLPPNGSMYVCGMPFCFFCTNINECSRDPSPCGPDSICTNTPGSYTCRCRSGYLTPSQPGAPFSCPVPRLLCLENATCTRIPGGHCCPCKPGFASSSGEQRVTDPAVQRNDIDECSRDPSPCGPNSTCSNTLGSYTCMCQAGYLPPSKSGTPFSCTDIDECSRDPSPCGPNSICSNTPGSYTCRCQAGYVPPSKSGVRFSCTDIDECSRDPSPCGPDSICTNTPGSYTCRCRAGYFPPSQPGAPFSCTDIDECSRDPSPCDPNSICSNMLGSYTCMCQAGYLPPSQSGVRFSCTDIDECSQDPSPCGPDSICTNTLGSYTCRCRSGSLPPSQPGAPFSCTDIDECSQDPSLCSPNSICTNTPGNYTCMCQAGYLPPSQPGAPFSCTEVTSKCRAHFLDENDLVPSCHPAQAAYCSLLKSTFRALAEPCKEKNSTVCLEKAAGGFASVLEQTSSWSNLSTEQLSVFATIVLHNVERIVMDILTNPTENGNLTFHAEQLDVRTTLIGDGCSREDSVISLRAKGDTMEISCRMVQGSTAQGAAGVAFASYEGMETIMNGSFFQGQKATSGRTIQMISRVVSAWLTSQTKIKVTDPVNYTFQHIMPSNCSEKPVCVSWETTAQGGSWSPAGCRILSSNATHTTCICNHVSSLAVLMACGEIMADFLLFLITHVGLALSLLCLLLAILTFLLCRSIRNVNTSIHLQLCLCLFVADLLFLTAVDRTRHQVGCAVIAGFLHYLFLACFAWMFLEAVVLLLTVRNLGVVNNFHTHSPKIWFLSLFGYGFPTLVVAVSATLMPKAYSRQENCWLSMERGFIWSFLGPVCVIVGINSILFAVTLWMLQRKLSSVTSNVSTLKDTRLLTFKAIAQVFILGCTWTFGLLQTGPTAVVMTYLFIILNSLQGVFIFLVHCLLNRQVQEEYKRWFTSKSKSYSEVPMSTLATSSQVVREQMA